MEFLLDHGIVVSPVNPKALDRARDLSACIAQAGRFRLSAAKSDRFDARVLAEFLRTDHPHLAALAPSSAEAQEMKLLTRDHARLVRHHTRLLNQLTITLKEYYPRAVEVLGDWTTPVARDFLKAYPTPDALAALRSGPWRRFARAPRLSEARTTELWEQLRAPQVSVPAPGVRTKARLLATLLTHLEATHEGGASYRAEIERFFATLPAAQWMQTLPGGKSGSTVPTLWADLGDAPGRWPS